MTKTIAIMVTSAALLMGAGTSHAQPSMYIGGAIGQSEVDFPGYDKATSWQLFGGANLTKYIAAEAAYTDLGQFDVNGLANSHINVDGFEVTAVGNLPIAPTISLFAEAGVYFWDLDATIIGAGIGSDDGTDLTYGVGVRFGLMPSLRMHAEYQVYTNVSDEDIDTFYAGLSFGF